MDLHEVISEYQEQKKIDRNEGRKGVENLCKLVNAMGYKDRQYFGQFAHDGSFGDLIEFLEDNPGCIEAIKEWIGNQDIQEWKENLESELPVTGKCPECGGDIEFIDTENEVLGCPNCDS